MKAITVEKQGGELKVVDKDIPEPADDQLLIKIFYAAINPVETFIIDYGLLVDNWPTTPGCDFAGTVVKAGSKARSALGGPFKPGTLVCACTRLGLPEYATFQEYNLVDAPLVIPVPGNLTPAQACTIGAAAYTAALAVFLDLNVPIPDPENPPQAKDEWALVLGGASSVGRMGLQILKIAGYKTIATASSRSADGIKAIGVDEVVDYKQSEDAMIDQIIEKTGGKVYRVFDAVAQNLAFPAKFFAKVEGEGKWFTTTNDWDEKPPSEGFSVKHVALGPIGRSHATDLNAFIEKVIPFLARELESGRLKPSEYDEVGAGVTSLVEAYAYQRAGKGGNKKVIVKIQD